MHGFRETRSFGFSVRGKNRGRKFSFSEQDMERLRNLVAEKPNRTPRGDGEGLGFDV